MGILGIGGDLILARSPLANSYEHNNMWSWWGSWGSLSLLREEPKVEHQRRARWCTRIARVLKDSP